MKVRMHHMTIRNVDPVVKAALEERARADGVSQTEAARQALARGLGVKVPRRRLRGVGQEVLGEAGPGGAGAPRLGGAGLLRRRARRVGARRGGAHGRRGGVILDTMALVRLLRDELSEETALDLEAAEVLVVSGASFFEINQKVRVGKLAMASLGEREIAALAEQDLRIEPVSAAVMAHAAALCWTYRGRKHRDPFDRMIAAAALAAALPVVTSDPAFGALAEEGLVVYAL